MIQTLSNYLGITTKQMLEEMTFVGAVTLSGIYHYPVLTPESPRMGNKSLFSKLKSLQRLPNAYYGVGGETQPYRTLLGFIGMRRYVNTLKKLTGMQPRMILYDASLYDFVNKLEIGEKASEITNNVYSAYNDASSKVYIPDPKGWRVAQTLLE